MPEKRSLAPALRELDREIGERGMPVGARARVAERLRREAIAREATSGFRFRWLPALTFAAGAALVLLVVSMGLRPSVPADESVAAASVLGVFAVEGEDCSHREGPEATVLHGSCRLVASHMTIQTWDRVVLRQDDALRLVEGTALFEVEHVPTDEAPVRIHVSHGTIEVIGTRFTIEQGPTGGHVDLFAGRIRFVARDGERTEIEPGQRHAWGDEAVVAVVETPVEEGPTVVAAAATGREPEPKPVVEPEVTQDAREAPTPTKRRAKARGTATRAPAEPPEASEEDATAIIEQVTELRAQGRFADAAAVLRRAETERRWDRRTAQVLSYELGEIIERHLGEDERACAHWARHAERFPGGRYDGAVKAARQRLGCQASDPE